MDMGRYPGIVDGFAFLSGNGVFFDRKCCVMARRGVEFE
jgi:hypothetical protein